MCRILGGENVMAQREADAPGAQIGQRVDAVEQILRSERRIGGPIRYPVDPHARRVMPVGVGDAIILELRRVVTRESGEGRQSKREGGKRRGNAKSKRHRHRRGHPVVAKGLKLTSRSNVSRPSARLSLPTTT